MSFIVINRSYRLGMIETQYIDTNTIRIDELLVLLGFQPLRHIKGYMATFSFTGGGRPHTYKYRTICMNR